jgi:Golgi nucleoside diphosphatase
MNLNFLLSPFTISFLFTLVATSASLSPSDSNAFIQMTAINAKHPLEDSDSWEIHQSSIDSPARPKSDAEEKISLRNRRLHRHHHHHHHYDDDSLVSPAERLEKQKEAEFLRAEQDAQVKTAEKAVQEKRKRQDMLHELYANPGIDRTTTHGLMIDAGSTGSRLHVYEWAPRVLRNEDDIQDAVSGSKLSFPGTESRWTDRLKPGLSSFASIHDTDELKAAVADYLEPLLDFARTVLHSKQESFARYPIFLRATAGMRTLEPSDRARVMNVVRDLFKNNTYCPFAFVDEQARVLSGEEEAIFDWAGVNFLMGQLLEQSEGAGTVINPKSTHGALDLGGASTQISFYEPNEDIMSNLFKLQIGQAKHWNVYAHSFLMYGMNEAINRFQARLAADKTPQERVVEGIYNPCLPGGSPPKEFRSNIHLTTDGVETWKYQGQYPSGDGFYQAILKNDNDAGDFDHCMNLTKALLHLENNEWCRFSHRGDCGLAGVYQPDLPTRSDTFQEFVAFSNFYHVWKFLQLPEKATVGQLYNATKYACSLNHHDLLEFTKDNKDIDEGDADSYCFRSVYAFQLLHNGYGFGMEDSIRATKVIDGHKVGWALGAMLYEINTMPWEYNIPNGLYRGSSSSSSDTTIVIDVDEWKRRLPSMESLALILIAVGVVVSLVMIFVRRRRRDRSDKQGYEPVKEVDV